MEGWMVALLYPFTTSLVRGLVCTKYGQNPLKDVDSRVSQGCYRVKIRTCDLENQ
jgi:hypothetical protein